MTTEPARTRRVEANGVSFALHEAGPQDGPLVLCLHGFPDTAWTWRHLLVDLAAAGYHAVAPFMRGYAPTSLAPDGRYPMGSLVADVLALHDVLGGTGDSALVGHDWGAPAAYGAAAFDPGRFRKIVAGGVPPTLSFLSALFRFAQLKRSWYIWFFQTPLADGAVAADDLALISGLWADWSPGYDATFDLAKVRESLATPERLAAALAYYRAMLDPAQHVEGLEAEQAAAMQPVPQPTLYYHGLDDGCLGAEAVTPAVLDHLGPGSRLLMVEKAGHFAHLEQPAAVNSAILDWLAS
ncbi:MAG: alpha/beta fold hydrolase [Acidimicrobiales bacterium]